ncbi:superfamily II DNA or RNA helicase [Yasminevirus sp. GU-2018]|uniref:Superfamily II DNA or RNA helicase n=1 Tax=Yasminevirus sp. GU-2018 TaxID=2420051 RepID=A0A5K0U873_9VIRU|nr:superfamily II DNA or RNA helicase [Yasminevirus sp. GU-2018]
MTDNKSDANTHISSLIQTIDNDTLNETDLKPTNAPKMTWDESNTSSNNNSTTISKTKYNKPKGCRTKLTNQGYHIYVTSISKEKIKEIETDLTVVPYRLDATKAEMEASKFSLFKYSKNRLELIVPRYYGVGKFGPADEEEFETEDIDIAFTKTLREIQTAVCERCIKYMKRNGGGLLSVPCGFGKTVCAIYIAHRLGLKTLVVVHKSFLINQWMKSILDFLNIDKSRVGIIRQKKCDVVGKDIVIGMIHTIAKREYKNVFDNFGLVIYDEAHHVACKFFSKALLKTGSQYTLALTATPYRGDGMIKVMYWFLGGTMYRESIKINKNVIVKVINHRSTDQKLFSTKKKWLKGKMRADTGKMTTNICEIDTRNQTIIDTINHIRRTEPERKILVLSGRKAHLDKLKEGVDKAIQEDIDAGIIDDEEIYSCYYIGDTKPVDRQEAEERGDIIFATYDMAHEGLDIKHLNTVILASPKKDVMQSIGRVMRTILQTGDVRPMVLDFADDIHAIGGWLKIRQAIYTKCKYEIENYYLVDDKFVTSFEYNGIDLTKEDVHHEDSFINYAINKHNMIHNRWKRDIETFERLCRLHEQQLKEKEGGEPIVTEPYTVNTKFNRVEYKELNHMEFTKLEDILFVPKLKEEDFDRKIIKDVGENDPLDLDADMEVDLKDAMNEISVMQAIKRKDPRNVMPTRKLFR